MGSEMCIRDSEYLLESLVLCPGGSLAGPQRKSPGVRDAKAPRTKAPTLVESRMTEPGVKRALLTGGIGRRGP